LKRDWLIGLSLFVIATVLFAPARGHEFINYDDQRYVREPMVQRGLTLEGVRWAFTTTTFANWHPVTWLSHMLDAELFGDDPAGHHLISVLLHALNAVVVFVVVRNLTGRVWESAGAAGLFAVHPLRVESVAWAAERKDLLCLFFFMLSLGAYVRWVKLRRSGVYAASLAMFGLALMSKPMAVSLPLVLVLVDLGMARFPLKWQASWRSVVWEKIPFVCMSIASCVITMIAQRRGGAMSESVYTPPLRAMNAMWSYARYLWLTIWPRGLAVIYPYEGALPGTMLPMKHVVLAALIMIGLTVGAVLMWRRNRLVMVGWLWFILTLLPTIGIVQVGQQAMADRYTYLPHVGLIIAGVFAVAELVRTHQKLRLAAAVSAAVVIAALCVRTRDQLRHWQNNITLFTHALSVTQHNHVAHSALAQALFDQNDLAGALSHYQRAIAIKPADAQPYYNVGLVLMAMGNLDDARPWFDEALKRYPDFPEAHVAVGNLLAAQGNEDEAIHEYAIGAKLAPHLFSARYNLGLSLARTGKVADAVGELAEAVKLGPRHADARFSYALALEQLGRRDEAAEQWVVARRLAEEQQNQVMLTEIQRHLPRPSSNLSPL
jgi:protein O-mannosyl-transferase